MKKTILLGIILLIFVTGCGTTKEEKMVCTRTATMNGMELDFRYEVYYQGNNVNKVKTREKVKSESDVTLKNLESQAKTLYSNFDKIKNYNYSVTIEDNTLISTTNINYQKINIDELLKIDSSINQLLNDNNKIDIEKITKVYEQTGATCSKK